MEEEDEDEFVSEQDGDEFVSDEDHERIPKAIPIRKDTVGINNQTTGEVEEEYESEDEDENSGKVSDINVDDYGSDEEDYDSDELDQNTTENPHGFVYAGMLETFSKSKKDRMEEMRADKDADAHKAHRDKFKKKKNTKKIGKSERVHQKNKPFMMVKQKKIRTTKDNMQMLNQNKDRTKKFIGHYSKR